MRSRRAADRYPTLLVLLLLSLVSTACNVRDDYRFAYGGIGTELHTGGIAQRYHVGEMYFGYLCGKANLPVVDGASVGGLPVCSYGEFFEQDWNRMVQAGLNDIDARCDAYLAWQDERKRLGPARVAQLNTTSQFVQAIIGIYEPTSLAIRVVSHAFGFATASFENYNQRLLYQIDTSTLQSLVITRQQTFRTQLVKQGISFNGKPSVEHGLRSYLRICMPMTIETEINNVLTVFDRTDVRPDDLISVDTSAAAVKAGRARTAREPFKPVPTPPPPIYAEAEKMFDVPVGRLKADVENVQKMICAKPDGDVGPATKEAIYIVEDMIYQSDSSKFDGKLNEAEIAEISGYSPQECEYMSFRGRWEKFLSIMPAQKALLITSLNKLIPGANLAESVDFNDVKFRAAIKAANALEGITRYPGIPDDVATRNLFTQIVTMAR